MNEYAYFIYNLRTQKGGLFSPSLQPLFLRSHSKFQLPFRDLINLSSDFASYSRNLVIFRIFLVFQLWERCSSNS
ncbi:hypothetical protein L1987_53844 [Smallanthus sonchifolius]|uniref:Uncharacterized protein n=1 Tax=Smallanthus sonchifolius TaxID=185202 RepID=A0ACB9EX26_9ASTR|nr:hypothetical protein L1987_53844 [Smallanthus sonchifolius]